MLGLPKPGWQPNLVDPSKGGSAVYRTVPPVFSLALLAASIILAHPLEGVAAQEASPMPMGTVVQFDVRFRDTILAASDAGLALGDRFILSDRLLREGVEVGHNAGVCTITDAEAAEALCEVTWAVPGGTISTQFLNTPPPEKAFAIVGGTGHYAGARGSGTLVEFGDETGTVTFDLSDEAR